MNSAHIPCSFTRRLTTTYITVLGTIALLVLLYQGVIQFELQQASNDAHIINIAGQQRLLSQELSNESLMIFVNPTGADQKSHGAELKNTMKEWKRIQIGLQHGDTQLNLPGKNSQEVVHLFTSIVPDFNAMLIAGKHISLIAMQGHAYQTTTLKDDIYQYIQIIMNAEPNFLLGMNAIVFQYEQEAQQHLMQIQGINLLLFVITLLVLLLEGIFIFRPTVARVGKDITTLLHIEERIAYMTEIQRKSQVLNSAFRKALPMLKYPVQIVAPDRYQVQDEQNRTYTVALRELNGNQLLGCECEMYKRNLTCAHFIAAASRHASLLTKDVSQTSIT